MHEDVRTIAAATGVDYALDVVLDGRKCVAAAFGGSLSVVHERACELVRKTAMRPVDGPFDVVLTCNAGFLLDQNLYQSVKGISAAAQVVKPGGAIICAAECRDGFPDHGEYRAQLAAAASPAALLADIVARDHTVPDQWQLQIQAKLQMQARVLMHTSYLSDHELAEVHLEQTHDVGADSPIYGDSHGTAARCA